jgi:hypothetical protein
MGQRILKAARVLTAALNLLSASRLPIFGSARGASKDWRDLTAAPSAFSRCMGKRLFPLNEKRIYSE